MPLQRCLALHQVEWEVDCLAALLLLLQPEVEV